MSKKAFNELMKEDTAPEPSTLAKLLAGAKEVGGAFWDGAKPMAEHGCAELASAMFNGNAHVPYGWSHADAGEAVAAPKTPDLAPEQQKEAQEIER